MKTPSFFDLTANQKVAYFELRVQRAAEEFDRLGGICLYQELQWVSNELRLAREAAV